MFGLFELLTGDGVRFVAGEDVNLTVIKDFVVLSHEPLPFVINQMYVNLFGHVHDSPMFETWGSQYACLCVERHQYYPVKEETIIEHFIGGK
jgi:hypothetical protein